MSGDAAWRHSARCIYCFYSWCWSLDFTESESGNFTRKWKLDSFRSPVSFLTMRPTTPAQQSRFGQGTCAHECLGSVLWALESTWVRIMLNWRGLLSHRYNFDWCWLIWFALEQEKFMNHHEPCFLTLTSSVSLIDPWKWGQLQPDEVLVNCLLDICIRLKDNGRQRQTCVNAELKNLKTWILPASL